MKVTTKSIYAIKSIILLEKIGNENHAIGIQQISDELAISNKYLEQIFSALKKAGILSSVRGVSGGYILNKPASEINLFEIIMTMDGEITSTYCEKNRDCSKCETCSIFWVLEKMKILNEDFLRNVSIAELSNMSFPIIACEDK